MRRFLIFLRTELLAARASIMFHIAAFASPLMFLMVFALNLGEDITFPIMIEGSSPFRETALSYASPAGVPYLKQDDAMRSITLKETEPVRVESGVLRGRLSLGINEINTNLTKNYRNRVTGALSAQFSKSFPGRAVTITEHPLYEKEPRWVHFFSVSICLFGILLSGFLFGSLSFTNEWESNAAKIMMLSPRGPALLLAGKLAGAFCKGGLTMTIYLVCSYLITGISLAASWLLVPFFLFAYFFSITAGMVVGLHARQTLVSFIVSLIGALVLWVFGGGFGTSGATPGLIKTVTGFNPVNSLLKLLQRIEYRAPSAPFDLWYPAVWIFLLSAALWWSYRKLVYLPARGKGGAR